MLYQYACVCVWSAYSFVWMDIGAVFLHHPENYEECLDNGVQALFTDVDPPCSYSLVAASLTDYDPGVSPDAEISWTATDSLFCVRYRKVPLKTKPDEHHDFDLCIIAGSPLDASENVHSAQDARYIIPPGEAFLAGAALDRDEDLNSASRIFSWSGVFCRYWSMTDPRVQGQEWFVGNIRGPEPGTSQTTIPLPGDNSYIPTPLVLDPPLSDSGGGFIRKGSVLGNRLLLDVTGADGETLDRIVASTDSTPVEVHQCGIPGFLCHSPSFVSAAGNVFVGFGTLCGALSSL